MKTYDIAETALNVVGVGFSLANIENILSIVLLIVSLLSMTIRAGISIYHKLKKGDVQGAIDDATDLGKKVDEIKESTKHE